MPPGAPLEGSTNSQARRYSERRSDRRVQPVAGGSGYAYDRARFWILLAASPEPGTADFMRIPSRAPVGKVRNATGGGGAVRRKPRDREVGAAQKNEPGALPEKRARTPRHALRLHTARASIGSRTRHRTHDASHPCRTESDRAAHRHRADFHRDARADSELMTSR